MNNESREKKKTPAETKTSDKTHISINDQIQMRTIGERIGIFRELVGLSRYQLARLLHKKTAHLKCIEKGNIFPDIEDLFLLGKKFGLDSNWVTTGKGQMFAEKGPCTTDIAFFTGNNTGYKNPKLLQYAELYNLMAIPVVEKEMLDNFERFKKIFSNEIKVFQYRQRKKIEGIGQ